MLPGALDFALVVRLVEVVDSGASGKTVVFVSSDALVLDLNLDLVVMI